MYRGDTTVKSQQWGIKSIHLLRAAVNICCITANFGHFLNFFLSVSEWVTVLFSIIVKKEPPLTPSGLDSSGNVTQEEERERAPPCGEATAVHLNQRVRDSSIATVLHSNIVSLNKDSLGCHSESILYLQSLETGHCKGVLYHNKLCFQKCRGLFCFRSG